MNSRPFSCCHCAEVASLDFDFSMAFQAIVNVNTQSI